MKKTQAPQYTRTYAEDIVFDNIPKNCKKILDFGCGDAHFAVRLLEKANAVYGCDADMDVIAKDMKFIREIKFAAIKPRKKTGYTNNFFDCVTLMGVLEHVADEKETIRELYRITKPGGILFIFVHNKGLLRFLDGANLKHLFPSIHRFFWIMFYGKKSYEKEFVDKRKYGMVGDTAIEKKWHTHYSKSELESHLGNYFAIDSVFYYSFFIPILYVLEFLSITLLKRRTKITEFLIQLDHKIDWGGYSYNIVAKCIKKS
jgi:2-polyprenyl-3-methyl-5-hydroxy-6-metoxy-1,4-benzoquinol methylase